MANSDSTPATAPMTLVIPSGSWVEATATASFDSDLELYTATPFDPNDVVTATASFSTVEVLQ